MTKLEDAIREALIQEEAVPVADADLLVPYLVDVARTMVLIQSAHLNVAERTELISLRRQIQAANIDISSMRGHIANLSTLHDDARKMISLIGQALGCDMPGDVAKIVAAAEEERQKVADLQVQLLDEQRQRARIADTLNEINHLMEQAKLREEGKS